MVLEKKTHLCVKRCISWSFVLPRFWWLRLIAPGSCAEQRLIAAKK